VNVSYNKEARIAELKAMPREELEALARKLSIRLKPGFHSLLNLARKIEEREFSDLRMAGKREHIGDIF
jgi:hypothetical protein